MNEIFAPGWQCLGTKNIPPSERLDYWHHATNSLFPPTQVRRQTYHGFYGQVAWREFGCVTLADIVSTDLEVLRREQEIDTDEKWYELNLQLEGTSAFAQAGRDTVTPPRSAVLYDSRAPYAMRFDGPYRQLSLKLPRQALRDRVPGIDFLTARRIDADTLPGRFLLDFLSTLCERRDEPLTPSLRDRIGLHVIDLLSTALLGMAQAPSLSAGRQSQLARIKMFILHHLDDPDLSPSGIARAQKISLRTLYELFAGENEQVAQWIKRQRLERVRADLADPLLQGWPITSLALRRGFKDFSHFSRVFKQRYGIAPREFRTEKRH